MSPSVYTELQLHGSNSLNLFLGTAVRDTVAAKNDDGPASHDAQRHTQLHAQGCSNCIRFCHKKQLPLTRKLSTACATLLNFHPFLTQKACALKTEHFFLGPFRKSCSQGNFRVTDIKVSTHAPKGQLYRFDKPWGVSLLEGSTWGVSLLEGKHLGRIFA